MSGSAMKTISLTWPFAVWGINMVGNLKTAPGGYTHLLVVVDKFTKWVEAKPIKKCDGKTATKFLRELIYRYGYPHNIITDNDTNFANGEMADFCEENGIRLDLASVAHPESIGQAERANKSILLGIKPRLEVPLERGAGCWAEELPYVLWGIRTTPNRSTGYTPFFLVYGAEAVMPPTLTTTRHELQTTPKKKTSALAKTALISSMKNEISRSLEWPYTSRASDAITVAASAVAPSKRATSSFG